MAAPSLKALQRKAVNRHWRLLIVVFPLLIAFSCAQRESGEALKREAERARRLEAELHL